MCISVNNLNLTNFIKILAYFYKWVDNSKIIAFKSRKGKPIARWGRKVMGLY
jgi:hypothetical protein